MFLYLQLACRLGITLVIRQEKEQQGQSAGSGQERFAAHQRCPLLLKVLLSHQNL